PWKYRTTGLFPRGGTCQTITRSPSAVSSMTSCACGKPGRRGRRAKALGKILDCALRDVEQRDQRAVAEEGVEHEPLQTTHFLSYHGARNTGTATHTSASSMSVEFERTVRDRRFPLISQQNTQAA